MLVIDGADIRSEADFHRLMAGHPKVPTFYGKNLYALRDAITGLIERPFSILWFNAEHSEAAFGEEFHKLIAFIKEVEADDDCRSISENEKFRLHLSVGPLQFPSEKK